jgi:hypothetical protein
MALQDIINEAEKGIKDAEIAKAVAANAELEAKVEAVAKEAVAKAKEPVKAAPVEVVEEETAVPTEDKAKLAKAIESMEDEESEVSADEKGMVKLPFKSFERRVQRAAKAALRSVFGTDDREAILKMKGDYESMLAKQDEDRRSKMDEVARIKEDKDRAENRVKELETLELQRQEAVEAEATEQLVNKISNEHIDPEFQELAHFKFAKMLKRKSEEELAEYTDEKIADWFQKFSVKNPTYARKVPAPKAKAPLSVGAVDTKKPNPKGVGIEDTKKSTASDDIKKMSAKDFAIYKRQNGYSY